MANKKLLNEIRNLQKIAGILKEYIESDPETIAQAFQKAGIDLSKPVTYVADYGSPGGTDQPKRVLGSKLLTMLQAERSKAEAENPEFNQTEGITYEYNPEEEPMEGQNCKLYVQFSDSKLYEIYQ
jgi:hypothetical protein